MQQEEDVLDTWFSSALWPHSTLGWPQPTAELEYYYPTSTLITSLRHHHAVGSAHGADRSEQHGRSSFPRGLYSPEDLGRLWGNDVQIQRQRRRPRWTSSTNTAPMRCVSESRICARKRRTFACPCSLSVLTASSRWTRPKRTGPWAASPCKHCGKPFSTQWALTDEEKSLPRGLVISDKFEEAGKFGNKLWNVARLCLMNLEGNQPFAIRHERRQRRGGRTGIGVRGSLDSQPSIDRHTKSDPRSGQLQIR